MTATRLAEALHGSGRGWIAQCPAHEDREPSLRIAEGDNKVLVHCHAGCAQPDVIAALQARGLWPEPERKPWTRAQRSAWAAERARTERILPDARLWRRAALLLAEELIDEFKGGLALAETARMPEIGELHTLWLYQRLLVGLQGANLVAEYDKWLRSDNHLTRGMVEAARRLESAEIRALRRWLEAHHGE